MTIVLPILTLESQIKRRLRNHLKSLGFDRDDAGELRAPSTEKDTLRILHRAQRLEKIADNENLISSRWDSLRHFFADGLEVDVERISPRIERVASNTWQADLFRLASLTWSVPVSSGYGRRLRFLVWDECNGKLIGIFALGDPVFNLRARDDFVGWTTEDRKDRLVNVLDAYVLGAVPPYNSLLGGKLVACLTNSTEVQEEFRKAYGKSVGLISTRRKNPKLALITTTSSLGRSSIYNRLKLGDRSYFRPVGFTEGWGHFHVPSQLFDLMRTYLRAHNHPYASNHGYGDGPNWRLRTVKAALGMIGMSPNLLRHGIGRQVFVSELADNACEVLCGRSPKLSGLVQLSAGEIGNQALDRWMVPRAMRVPEYKSWQSSQLLSLIYAKQDVEQMSLPHLANSPANVDTHGT
ncbi:MAG: Druantia anti-phage system protein DruA [Pseudomonadota bacterium]